MTVRDLLVAATEELERAGVPSPRVDAEWLLAHALEISRTDLYADGDEAPAGREAVFRFIDGLRLVLPATSLGDIYTLVTAPLISSHRDLTPEQRAERGIGEGLVRLSIGIEEVGDIVEDLRAALRVCVQD